MNRVLLGIVSISLLFNILFLFHSWRQNIVISVPDGDSLQLADGRRVRLLGLDAPEKGRCMAETARETLSGLALHKRVTLKDVVTDSFGRQLAHVYTTTFINDEMVSRGLAKPSSSNFDDTKARQQKLGIWSETCRKTANPTCPIKGNMRADKKTYLLPGCKNYNQTIIDESFGDQWFCTEQEAVAGGFTRASGCIQR